MASSTFGLRLRIIREHRGLTQADLAYAIGRSRATINNWERGPADVRTSDAERCAQALQCHRRDLYAPIEAPVPPPMSSRRKHRRVARAATQTNVFNSLREPLRPDELEALLREVLQWLAQYEPDVADLIDRMKPPSKCVVATDLAR